MYKQMFQAGEDAIWVIMDRHEMGQLLCPTLSGISSIVHRELTFRLFTGSKARHASEAT